MKQASERFGVINISKGEDDGAVFRNFIRESRRNADRRGLATDTIAEVLEKGKVSPLESSPNAPSKIAFHSSFPFAPRCVPLNPAESQHIHDDYRTQSWPSFPWRFPSNLAFSRWPSQMGSVWIVECAYTPSRRRSTNAQRGSVPRFCVPQNFRANARAWSGGRSPQCPRALSFGCVVCAGDIAFYRGLTQYSVGCLSAVPLLQRF
jgi:hypothetical protein